MKPNEIILWHDNNIVLNIEGSDIKFGVDESDPNLPYRWVEIDTGHKFAELDGWHYRIRHGKDWTIGWEEVYED